jgi:hypothetical protein
MHERLGALTASRSQKSTASRSQSGRWIEPAIQRDAHISYSLPDYHFIERGQTSMRRRISAGVAGCPSPRAALAKFVGEAAGDAGEGIEILGLP